MRGAGLHKGSDWIIGSLTSSRGREGQESLYVGLETLHVPCSSVCELHRCPLPKLKKDVSSPSVNSLLLSITSQVLMTATLLVIEYDLHDK